MTPNRTYLGDGVYAWHDGFHFVLETSDGISTTNQIFIEDYVLQGLFRLVEKVHGIKVTVTQPKTEGEQDESPSC